MIEAQGFSQFQCECLDLVWMELKYPNRKTPCWDITQHYDRIRIWNVYPLNKYKNMEYLSRKFSVGFYNIFYGVQNKFLLDIIHIKNLPKVNFLIQS